MIILIEKITFFKVIDFLEITTLHFITISGKNDLSDMQASLHIHKDVLLLLTWLLILFA